MGFKHKNTTRLQNVLQVTVDLVNKAKAKAGSNFKGNTFSTIKETQFIFLWKNFAAREHRFSIFL